ncbi:hypothetical protein EDM56_18170 [Brevibacillus fluminis]|uniref:Uncharacterized protein n=1 Tax=Brevibacillus fluminis TaxID=511487 RepID=A0A3M8DD10_9BACL|nr:hypothetical protein [Brevibacillus fluminis]RNB85924.1 hypothetical protein EDM56_18170 [Brevibacillus fluminis]
MHNRQHLIQQHHEWAHAHQTHANALHQQAHYHQQQAQFHHHQAMSHTQGMDEGQYTTTNPMMTAYNNQVSPAALVFHGNVSPQSMQSINQYQNQYSNQNAAAPHVHLSNHMAHANENQASMQRGHKF